MKAKCKAGTKKLVQKGVQKADRPGRRGMGAARNPKNGTPVEASAK